MNSHDVAAAYSGPSFGQRLTSISRARVTILGLATVYFAAYGSAYIAYVGEFYVDLGFGFAPSWSDSDVSVIAFLAIAPSLWLPATFKRLSAVFIYFQYFFIYVPAIWMTHHSVLPLLSPKDQTVLCVALPLSFGILLWSHHRIPLLKIPNVRIQGRLLWMTIYAVSGFLLIVLIGGLGGNFRLVALSEIYSLRDSASDAIEASGSTLLKYAFPWFNGLLLPMIYARAVQKSNYLMVFAVLICYVFLFGIWGSKTSLFGPLILVAASIWAWSGTSRMPLLMIIGLIIALIVPALLPFESGVGNLIKLGWITVVNMRTFSIPGLAISQYYDFFSTHAWTLGSQVTGLSWFVHYPYDYNIPQTLGYYYYGTLVTANANFWAQDGLASFGVTGLGVTSIVAALVFWVVDSVTHGLSMKFLIPSLVGVFVSFANVSLFTTLMTGGLGFFILACVFMPRAGQDFPAKAGSGR